MARALFIFLMLLAAPAQAQAQFEGQARAISGDLLEVGARTVVLYGIDAPEPEQTCERDGQPWTCGLQASFALAGLVERNWLECVERGQDAEGRSVAVCWMGGASGIEVNARMVAEGWAVADPETGRAYARIENVAKRSRRGLWAGEFVAPWLWRQGQR